MFICWGGGKAPSQTPRPFVMTQINEIKRNTLSNFIYAFPMSTANLHSCPIPCLSVCIKGTVLDCGLDTPGIFDFEWTCAGSL